MIETQILHHLGPWTEIVAPGLLHTAGREAQIMSTFKMLQNPPTTSKSSFYTLANGPSRTFQKSNLLSSSQFDIAKPKQQQSPHHHCPAQQPSLQQDRAQNKIAQALLKTLQKVSKLALVEDFQCRQDRQSDMLKRFKY